MTRSTNYSELRKMSNPIPININPWQIRSQKKIDETSQYESGIMDHCMKNSVSPHSGYSISPSPSQSISPEKNHLNKLLNQNNSIILENLNVRQTSQNQQINHLLNDSSQSSTHFDVQSELESLLVNATLSDGTLTSNMSQNDDNSNTSSRFTSLNNDDLCDIDMNFDTGCTHFNHSQFSNSINDINNNNLYSNINKEEKVLESELESNNISKNMQFNIRTSSKPLQNSSALKGLSKLLENENIKMTFDAEKIDDFKEKNLEKTTCDPVLTQVTLNTSSSNTDSLIKINVNSSSPGSYLNKRSLFNQNNSEDSFLPSINVSNLNNQNNSESQIQSSINFSTQSSLNFINQNETNDTSAFVERVNSQPINSLGLPINILKFNSNINESSDMLNSSYGQYSLSLPANSNFIEFASGNLNQISKQMQPPINNISNNNFNSTSLNIHNICKMEDSITENLNSSSRISSNFINSQTDEHYLAQSDYSYLSMSLPAYTADNYLMKYKQPNIQSQASFNTNINSFNSNLSNKIINRSDISSSPHLNKLLQTNTKGLNSFNSDSNLSCTNTAVSSIASMTSPLSNVQDEFENSLVHNLSNKSNNMASFLQDDDYDEQDSDEDSINNEAFFDLMNKNRDTYFWQYNIQSKGPKTKKVLTLRNKDPHLHRDFFDPVYQLQTINSRGTASNKLRKGDGNDVTPNSEKLFNLGLQIHDFIQKSYQMNSTATNNLDINNEKVNLKREKNKIASRACRLKKKAQHEANKLKLNGLNQEHKQLVETINIAKDLIKKRLKNELIAGTSLVETIEDVCRKKLTTKVAGNTDNYVYSLMQHIENQRMNSLPSAKGFNSSKKILNDISDESLVNSMMLIDSNTIDSEKQDSKGNINLK